MDGAEKIVGAPEAEKLNPMADTVQTSAQKEEQIQRGAWCLGEAYLLAHVGTKPS